MDAVVGVWMRRLIVLVLAVLCAGLLPVRAPSAAFAADPDPAPTVEATATPDPQPAVPAAGVHVVRHRAVGQAALDAEPAATTTSLNVNNVAFAQSSHLMVVWVQPDPGGGIVELRVNGDVVASDSWSGGAQYLYMYWTPPAAGEYPVQAFYLGTTGHAPSSSDTKTLTVRPPRPEMTLQASATEVAVDAAVTMTATLTPAIDEGAVQWWISGVIVGETPVVGGTAQWTTSFGYPARYPINARFLGTPNWSEVSAMPINVWALAEPIVLDVTVPADPIPAGELVATAALTPIPGGGTIEWRLDNAGTWTNVPVDTSDGVTTLPLANVGPGSHVLHAQFTGFGPYLLTTDQVTFDVLATSSTSLIVNPTSAYAGESTIEMTATVVGPPGSNGSVTFLDDVAGSVLELGPVPVGADGTATYRSAGLREGVHAVRARYDGGAGVIGSTSDPVDLAILPDTAVHASFAASLSTFYPYKDGYRDTVALRTVTVERATITVKVYAGSKLKRSWSLGTLDPGTWSVTWNGRTASGRTLPDARYTVKSVLVDAAGNTRTLTANVTISDRRVAWKTGTTIKKYGDQLAYYADQAEDRLFASSEYPRGRILYANGGWIDGLATFQLKKTGVLAYRKVFVAIEGAAWWEGSNPGHRYLIDPVTGNYEQGHPLPVSLHAGYGIPTPSRYVSSDGKVRVVLECDSEDDDAFFLFHLKLTYQYAVWQ